jgi:predicted phage terminase large subunit-like protein
MTVRVVCTETLRWKAPKIQDIFEYVWDHNDKSMVKAPREHLKTTSLLEYLVKILHTREFPLEINYYHHSIDMAVEKIRKMRRIIENNPLLYYGLGLDGALSKKEDLLILNDGSVLQPLSWKTGVVGKHPHIIAMDDVIDKQVIYSDEQNKKAIEKFYIDILPQITKMTKGKKIICIGTSQRKDDLYASLPADFYRLTLQAIVDEQKKKTLAPDLYSWEDLMKMKDSILNNPQEGGERFWLKEYMNIPFDRLGTIINSSQILYFYDIPPKLQIYQGWDLSVGKDLEKSDWTVGATIGVHRDEITEKITIYILDVFRKRLPFSARLEAVKDQYSSWLPFAVGIESVSFSYDTIQMLGQTTLIPLTEIKALKNKIESFQTELAPYFERLQVRIRADQPWTKELVNELLSLPTGSYDDQADAIKIAIKTALMYAVYGSVEKKEKEEGEENMYTAGLQDRVF